MSWQSARFRFGQGYIIIMYLVLGNCQSQFIKNHLGKRAETKNFIVSYPNVFSERTIAQQREYLTRVVGEKATRLLLSSGVLLPLPSKKDYAALEPDVVVVTIFHPRNLYRLGKGIIMGTSLTEADIQELPEQLQGLYSSPVRTTAYSKAFHSYVRWLTKFFPRARIVLVSRTHSAADIFPRRVCSFKEWRFEDAPMHRCLERLCAEGVGVIELEQLIRGHRKESLFMDELNYQYVDGEKRVDVEHLPEVIWEETARMIEMGHWNSQVEKRTFLPIAAPAAGPEQEEKQGLRDNERVNPLVLPFLQIMAPERVPPILDRALNARSVSLTTMKRLVVPSLQSLGFATFRERIQDKVAAMTTRDRDELFTTVADRAKRLGLNEDAVAAMCELSELNVDTVQLYGSLLRRASRHEMALSAYHKYMQTCRDSDKAYNIICAETAVTLYELGRFDEAWSYIRRLRRIETSPAVLWGVVAVSTESLRGDDVIVIRSGPQMVLDVLIRSLAGVAGTVSLLTTSSLPHHEALFDNIYKVSNKMPLSEQQEEIVKQLSPLGFWDTAVVLCYDPDNLESHEKIIETVRRLPVGRILFYSSRQVFEGHDLEMLFARPDWDDFLPGLPQAAVAATDSGAGP
jgi:hypothetical protein